MSFARFTLGVLIAVAYGVLGAVLLDHAPPIWFVAALLVTLSVVVHAGIFFLNLAVFLDVVSHGEPGARAVSLTFDDGPHPVHTGRVLDALDEAGAKGTFFVIGAKAEAYPDVIADIVRRGHEVGLHSYAHDHLLFLRNEAKIVEDLRRTQDAIEQAAGVRPKLFRPPVGFSSPRTRVAVRDLGLCVVGWSARAFDGAGRPTPAQVVSRIEPTLRDGAIVLLHDAPERGDDAPTSLAALPELIRLLRARGLEAVTVSSLIGACDERDAVAQPAR